MGRNFKKYIAIIAVLFTGLHIGICQNICEGNLGENIFTSGDFGTGTDPFIRSDPGIAPGYIYSSNNQSPDDGIYQIVKNTGDWAYIFPTWLHITDNSDDPDGYMMVVNASFEPGIFFEQIIDDLCENTLYEFSADVINMIRSEVTDHILPDVSFYLDDELFFTTGSIQQTEQWNKYGFTFTTPPNTTELRLTLRNNAPGGIGNDLALDNISFRACGPNAFINAEQTLTLCENGTTVPITADIDTSSRTIHIQWQISNNEGASWEDIPDAVGFELIHSIFDPGKYIYRYLSAYSESNLQNSKCRIISDEISIEVLPIRFTVYDSICQNIAYNFGDESLFESGVYVDELIGKRGCDSIVTLYLEIIPEEEITYSVVETQPSCHGYGDGKLELTDLSGRSEPYQFFINGNLNESNVFDQLGAGEYLIEILDRFQCSTGGLIPLNEPESLVLNQLKDTVISLGNQLDMEVFSNFNIQTVSWEFENTLICLDCNPAMFSPTKSGFYTFVVEAGNGCVATDSIFVEVDKSIPHFIPNVISVRGDFPNNYFTVFVYSQGIQIIKQISIYDRWGNLIFLRENLPPNEAELGWDGRNSGEKLNPGVYVYFIELLLIDGEQRNYSGTVTLMD